MSSIDIVAPNGRRLPAVDKATGKRTKAPKGSTYKVRYRTPAGQSRSRTFDRKLDAERFVTSTEHSKQIGGYIDRSSGAVTVAEYAKTWIAGRLTKSGEPLRPRTSELYRQLNDKHITPTLGAIKLRDLTPERVRVWRTKLPGAVVPAKAYRLLRAMMATAVDDELIGRNPCRVEHGGVERSPERKPPTGDEVWRLADAIQPRYRAFVLLAAFGGLRLGELLGLERGDLNLDERTVKVVRAVVEVDGKQVVGRPKTDAGVREISLPPVLVGELRRHLDAYTGTDDTARVFAGPKGATATRTNLNRVWDKARTAIGRPGLHIHDLRHFGATLAAQAGATTKELMTRLGHTSPVAALQYQHATAERDHALAVRMDELIVGPAEPTGATLRLVDGA